ncbi:MAG: CBS domain-containing protein [Acidobacteria bacterium]|nr:CBS domain-containing protein [Acidobacteriota bacterium]
MRWALQLGHLYGISIRIHFTFLFLLAFLFLVSVAAHGWLAGLRSLLLLSLVFVCVLLHELAHSYVSLRYGLRVRSITLLPIGGLAMLEDLPRDPRQEIAIALAGPAANFVLALWLGVLLLVVAPGDLLRPVVSSEVLLGSLFWSNLYIGVFNLIPAYPLDGGRVLRAWLAARMDYIDATRRAVSVGHFFSLLFMLVGLVVWQPWLVVIGLFVFWAALAEERIAVLQSALERIYLEDVMLTEFQRLAPSDSLFDALDRALHSLQDDFPVVAEGRVVGVLTRGGLLRAFAGQGWNNSVQAVMSTRFEVAQRRDTLASAFRTLTGRGLSVIPVLEGETLVGIVTLQNLLYSIAFLSRKSAADFEVLRRAR